MKIKKRVFTILILITITILLLFFIRTIYAKYITTVKGDASIPISRWNLKLNSQQIINNSDISNLITPIFPGNNYISANVIAPTATGYFDLTLDYSAVDVAFKYEISVIPKENSAVMDLIVTGYSFDGGTTITNFVDYTNTKISKTIQLTDSHNSENIRIYLMWNDDSTTETMNNFQDALSANSTDSNAKCNVTVAFTQITETTNP